MDEIKDIVKKVFTNISSKTVAEQKKLGQVVEKVFENNKIGGVKIDGFKDKHLFINVDSSARLYQVNVIKKKILTELQSELPDIEKISFKVGQIT